MPAHPMTGCQQTPSSACALWLRSVFQWQWAAYAGGGAPSAGHRDELLCLYGPEADWWRAAGSANGRSSNEVQEDWSRQQMWVESYRLQKGTCWVKCRCRPGVTVGPLRTCTHTHVLLPLLQLWGLSTAGFLLLLGGTVEQVTFLLSFKLTHVK